MITKNQQIKINNNPGFVFVVPGIKKPLTMTIESKPLLILNMMAFIALIEKLRRELHLFKKYTDNSTTLMENIKENIRESEIMLEAITNELKNKHSDD